ncbi:MAG: Creatinine amidohydrolase, partial [uncultured Gemmatimonadetes bacterium]
DPARRPSPLRPRRPPVERGRGAHGHRAAPDRSHRRVRPVRAAPAAGGGHPRGGGARQRPGAGVRGAARARLSLRRQRAGRGGLRGHGVAARQDAAPRPQRGGGGVVGARLQRVHRHHGVAARAARGGDRHHPGRARAGPRGGCSVGGPVAIPGGGAGAGARGRSAHLHPPPPAAGAGEDGGGARFPDGRRGVPPLHARAAQAPPRRVPRLGGPAHAGHGREGACDVRTYPPEDPSQGVHRSSARRRGV